MNGYYGFEPSHLQPVQVHTHLPPAPTPGGQYLLGLGLHTTASGPRKREHPDANGGSENGLVNGFACNGTYGLDLEKVRVEQYEYESAKRVCLLDAHERCLGIPQAQATRVCADSTGPMDCSRAPRPNPRELNRRLNGVRLPFVPSDPEEADIVDMNPVAPGPAAVPYTAVAKMKSRRAQLCMMEELCSCAQTMGISVLECPRCLSGEAGHLMHILDNQGMGTH